MRRRLIPSNFGTRPSFGVALVFACLRLGASKLIYLRIYLFPYDGCKYVYIHTYVRTYLHTFICTWERINMDVCFQHVMQAEGFPSPSISSKN